MAPKNRDEHLFGPGSKRILALDGGGIRGILTLQLLRRIETLVRTRTGDSTGVLADYFDLVGGTSTGAIIAAALALGWDVNRIETVYRALCTSIFEPSWLRKGLLRPKFSAKPLRAALEREFGDVRLGGSELRTGLAVVAKRLDTGSPWVLHNNPRGRYFDRRPGSKSTPNKDYLLREVVRASTAAPTYFEPERISVAEDLEGAFVDGGVSPHNNPALQLLMLATLKGHGLEWATGADQILLVSLGTGIQPSTLRQDDLMEMKPVELGVVGLASLMDDASALNELLLQWMSSSETARDIDSEIGDLSDDMLGGTAPLLSYLRYDVRFETAWLDDTLNLTYSAQQLDSIAKMDKPENVDALLAIGAAAASLVEERHFGPGFDLREPPSTATDALRRYRKNATALVTAVRLDLETEGFAYDKWGGPQTCKAGDWLVDNDGDVYTVDQATFDRTYREVEPGRYGKSTAVWAEIAETAGVIETKEGETHYTSGDYLVYNAAGRRDGYAVTPDRFLELYEPLEPAGE